MLIAAALVSCATPVKFDVRHPPVVDLRGVSSLTVIPFEKGSSRQDAHLSARVTSALSNGIKNNSARGNISFIEPETLASIPEYNYWQYVDAFVTGRIMYITQNSSSKTDSRNTEDKNNAAEIVTLTVTVDIEYSYVSAQSGKALGTLRKSASFSETSYERSLLRIDDWHDHGDAAGPGRRRPPSGSMHQYGSAGRQNYYGGRRGLVESFYPRPGSWGERLAGYAIDNFSQTMSRELSSWTTTEVRSLRKVPGNDPLLDEAARLIKMERYDQAFGIYQDMYRQNNNAVTGYNAAVLLAANNSFAEALSFLENMRSELLASGQKIPRYVEREIVKMAELVDGLKVLDEYRPGGYGTGRNAEAAVAGASPGMAKGTENAGELRGIINLNVATVYALREPIASVDDSSVWYKLAASAVVDAFERKWVMSLPGEIPASLWFVVLDSHSNMYITKTALGTSGIVVLDINKMAKLE